MTETIMDASPKLPFNKTLNQIFERSFLSLPYVFKQTILKFGLFWFPIVFALSIFLEYTVSNSSQSVTTEYLNRQFSLFLPLFESCFTFFLIPYFVFKFINKQERRPTPSFWSFLSENMYPLVINHLKSTLLIIVYACMLFIPGVVKAIRFSFVNQATFFGKDYAEKSALKLSHELTRGFFWGICILFFISLALPDLTRYAFHLSLSPLFDNAGFMGKSFFEISKYLISFSVRCFGLILVTQAFFTLREIKGI